MLFSLWIIWQKGLVIHLKGGIWNIWQKDAIYILHTFINLLRISFLIKSVANLHFKSRSFCRVCFALVFSVVLCLPCLLWFPTHGICVLQLICYSASCFNYILEQRVYCFCYAKYAKGKRYKPFFRSCCILSLFFFCKASIVLGWRVYFSCLVFYGLGLSLWAF